MRLAIMYMKKPTIFISGDYVIVGYSMDVSINEVLNKNKEYLLRILKTEIEMGNFEYQELYEKFFELVEKTDNNIMNCFEKVEVDEIDVDTYNKLKISLENINVPVIIDFKLIEDNYLLDNIAILDNELKENGVSKRSYIIKQCVEKSESHGEDVSYSVSDVLLVLNYLKDITSNIRKYDLSPLEQVMYIYDLVKDRYYKLEEVNDDYLESRDIAKILKGDSIVCLGFSHLFKALLDSINIPCRISFLDGVNSRIGHARVFVGINDDKYNINQVLYFDPTWDCKKNKDSDNLLDRYNNFARSKKYFAIKDKKNRLVDNEYLPFEVDQPNYYIHGFVYRDCLLQIKILFSMIDWQKYFRNRKVLPSVRYELNNLMNADFIDYFVSDVDNFDLFMYKECSKMMDKNLPCDVFLECLTNVRKLESMLYSDKFSFDKNRLVEIYNTYVSNADSVMNNSNDIEEEYSFEEKEAFKELRKMLGL